MENVSVGSSYIELQFVRNEDKTKRQAGETAVSPLWLLQLVRRPRRLSTADCGGLISTIYRSFPPTRNNLSHLRLGRRPTGQ